MCKDKTIKCKYCRENEANPCLYEHSNYTLLLCDSCYVEIAQYTARLTKNENANVRVVGSDELDPILKKFLS